MVWSVDEAGNDDDAEPAEGKYSSLEELADYQQIRYIERVRSFPEWDRVRLLDLNIVY